nr:MAG TPA: hypothetical protein [Caudoviricetes sp.]
MIIVTVFYFAKTRILNDQKQKLQFYCSKNSFLEE